MHTSTRQITLKKVRGKNVDLWTSEITSKKVCGNNVDFSTIEITSKKVRENNVNFSTIEITSKKVRGNDVDFLTFAITSKKYAEMTWKFVEIWSLTYRRNIHVESTWIRRGVPFGILLLALDYCDFARIQVFPEISFLCGLNTMLEFNISLLSLIQFSFSCNSMISPVNLNLPFWKRCFIRNTQTLKMWICQVFKKLDLDIFNWIKPCYSNYNVP